MHKVITINLNGNAYQVEEGGYEALCDYLDAAEAQLRDNPDRSEIISDLEQAIADKCRNFLGTQKTIVTSSEIDQIIQEMGPVDGEAGSAREAQSEAKREPGSKAYAPRRLYRIREGKQIEGVCMGLSVYLGMDVTIVRLICVALAFASAGIAIGAYIVMTVVVPYAETSEDRAAAYGTQFNAQDFINQAKEHYSAFKSEFKKEGKEWKAIAKEKKHEWARSWRHTFRNERYRWRSDSPPPPPLLGIMLPIFGVMIGIISIIWVFAVISVINTHAIFGWPLPLRIPVWVAIVILIVLLNVVTGPFKYMCDARYGNPHGAIVALWSAMAWMAFLVFLSWLTYQHAPEVRAFVENLPNVWNEMVNR